MSWLSGILMTCPVKWSWCYINIALMVVVFARVRTLAFILLSFQIDMEDFPEALLMVIFQGFQVFWICCPGFTSI